MIAEIEEEQPSLYQRMNMKQNIVVRKMIEEGEDEGKITRREVK